MKKGKWTPNEDAFLMRWHGIGLEYIAGHDLGRSYASARRRFQFLTDSGARRAFAESQYQMIEYALIAAGAFRSSMWIEKGEQDYWLSELTALDMAAAA